MAAAAPAVAAVDPAWVPDQRPRDCTLPSENGDDESMTDDMRLAVSALGLMREGGTPTAPDLVAPGSTSTAAAPHRLSEPGSSSSRRRQQRLRGSNPSRSASTASSTASTSEAWTGGAASSSDTRESSPHGSASLAGGDTDMFYDEKPPYGTCSSSSSSSVLRGDGGGAVTAIAGEEEEEEEDPAGPGAATADPRFMARVSQLPVVSSGIEWYERSKAHSRVVKYGAGLVESSFSAVSRPVANALPPLGPLDDFACRQLDRIGAAPGASPGRKAHTMALPADAAPGNAGEGENAEREGGLDEREELDGREEDEMRGRRRERHPTYRVDGGAAQAGEPESQDPGRATSVGASAPHGAHGQQVATVGGGGRSRWQTVLLEAGGLGAAVSEESLKSLRYCLQWLLYATAHLDHQIGTLRDFILSLRVHARSSSASTSASSTASSSNALVAASASAHLAQIKHDVVETIRKVVDVMSKYAGAALPEQAKRYVRQCILGLPVKWASAIEGRSGAGVGMGSGRTTRESTVDGSELGTPRPERMGDDPYHMAGAAATAVTAVSTAGDAARGTGAAGEPWQDPALRPTEEAADRILTFAVESLDMLRSVTSIFSESVERAEAWIERLRMVGLDRQRQQRQAACAAAAGALDGSAGAFLPPASSPRIGSSTTQQDDDAAAAEGPPALAAGIKRRRTTPPSATSESDGTGAIAPAETPVGGASTALEGGSGSRDGEADEGAATRRKRGAWRTTDVEQGGHA